MRDRKKLRRNEESVAESATKRQKPKFASFQQPAAEGEKSIKEKIEKKEYKKTSGCDFEQKKGKGKRGKRKK